MSGPIRVSKRTLPELQDTRDLSCGGKGRAVSEPPAPWLCRVLLKKPISLPSLSPRWDGMWGRGEGEDWESGRYKYLRALKKHNSCQLHVGPQQKAHPWAAEKTLLKHPPTWPMGIPNILSATLTFPPAWQPAPVGTPEDSSETELEWARRTCKKQARIYK